MVASMMMTDFWDVAPCSLIEVVQRLTGAFTHLIVSSISGPLHKSICQNINTNNCFNSTKASCATLVAWVEHTSL
jgi:hypothetical protein